MHVLHALMRNSCTAWAAAGTLSGHSRSLAQRTLETQQCPALQIEPEVPAALCKQTTGFEAMLILVKALHSKASRSTPRCIAKAEGLVVGSLRIGTRSGRQHGGSMEASWRYHVGSRCFRLTSKPALLFFSPGARGQRCAWAFALMCRKLHVALAAKGIVLRECAEHTARALGVDDGRLPA